jgi:uncharacterized protein (TIGR03435 family)
LRRQIQSVRLAFPSREAPDALEALLFIDLSGLIDTTSRVSVSASGLGGAEAFAASMTSGKVSAHAQSIDTILTAFSGEVGRLIVDKTGLDRKKFDFELKWTPDNERAAAAAPEGEAGPSIFTALEEELGLKLVPSKEPLDVLVIDHIERPSPN